MLTFFLFGACFGAVLGWLRGYDRGWDSGIKVARVWEGFGRDWRMLYEIEIADTEHERKAIKEVRELNKMYDGV